MTDTHDRSALADILAARQQEFAAASARSRRRTEPNIVVLIATTVALAVFFCALGGLAALFLYWGIVYSGPGNIFFGGFLVTLILSAIIQAAHRSNS